MKLKLSEAIMLPSEIKFDPTHFLRHGQGCLLGQAMNAATGEFDCSLTAIIQQWPWLNDFFTPPPAVAGKLPQMIPLQGKASGERIISRYAFMVERGLLTREQCADWVRSVEPQESEQTEPIELAEVVNELP